MSHKLFNTAVWSAEISSDVELGRKVVMNLGGVVMACLKVLILSRHLFEECHKTLVWTPCNPASIWIW